MTIVTLLAFLNSILCTYPGSPDTMFISQPLNITVQPIDGVIRGAFSCSVFPDDDVQTITWYYGQGVTITSVNVDDPNVMVGSEGGTSVLVLENVGMDRQGFYHCKVMTSSDNLVSYSAYLTFDGESVQNARSLTYCKTEVIPKR